VEEAKEEGQAPPPGWYLGEEGIERWWDGSSWTEHRQATQIDSERGTPVLTDQAREITDPGYRQIALVDSQFGRYVTTDDGLPVDRPGWYVNSANGRQCYWNGWKFKHPFTPEPRTVEETLRRQASGAYAPAFETMPNPKRDLRRWERQQAGGFWNGVVSFVEALFP
jgi:hypothetical protein